MDMFPYPSGVGLHVGHPLGYIGTDVYSRFKIANGYNVLHPMGSMRSDSPPSSTRADRAAPRVTTDQNIANMRRQMDRLALGFDWRRSVATTDVDYYRWTQWIFLRLFNAFYDIDAGRARPISDLVDELDAGTGWWHPTGRRSLLTPSGTSSMPTGSSISTMRSSTGARARDGARERGGDERGPVGPGQLPGRQVPLKQWKMRITAYAERLLADLDLLDWPEPIKVMQRNWIGRSTVRTWCSPCHQAKDRGLHHAARHVVRRHVHGVAPEYEDLDALVARSGRRRRRRCGQAATPPLRPRVAAYKLLWGCPGDRPVGDHRDPRPGCSPERARSIPSTVHPSRVRRRLRPRRIRQRVRYGGARS